MGAKGDQQATTSRFQGRGGGQVRGWVWGTQWLITTYPWLSI